MEKLIERMLFGSRWLLAPIYLGLAAALGVLDRLTATAHGKGKGDD